MENKWSKELTESALLQEINQAKLTKQLADTIEPRANSVIYNSDQNLIVITLKNGVIFSIPHHLIQGLENATETQLNDVWLSDSGSSIHWDSLDADFSIPGLIAGVFGTEIWMNKLKVLPTSCR